MSSIKSNISALRNDIRKIPEILRTITGAMTSRIGPRPSRTAAVEDHSFSLRDYRLGQNLVPVQIVTPSDGHYMHTFFDVDPISPSGHYLAVTKVPFIWRVPYPGDLADICVIDLRSGICRTIYRTTGWGTQLGANVQWGDNDDIVYCNDVMEGRGTGIAISVADGTSRVLEGPIYGLTPDRKTSFSCSIELVNQAQTGYGIPERILRRPALKDKQSKTEGIWRTDLVSGKTELFLSIHDIVSKLPEQDDLAGGTYYAYNVKVNRQATRMLIALFSKNVPGRLGWPLQLVTCRLDGSNIELAVPDALWRKGGHHANWHPDGEHLIMNLKIDGKMRFTRFLHDGSDFSVIVPDVLGGGHPSVEPTNRWLTTDAYASEGLADKNGEIPIRLLDMVSGKERTICRITSSNLVGGRRIDPHPVWSQDFTKLVFNAVVDGKRQVFIADMTNIPET